MEIHEINVKKIVLFQTEADIIQESFPPKISKKKSQPAHQHELVVLSHLVKQRLRKLIRQQQNRHFFLHLKRQYKRSARDRKLFRRSEYQRKRKAAEKVALKKLSKGAAGKKADQDEGETSTKTSNDRFKPSRRHQKWRENKFRKWKKIKLRAKFMQQEDAHRWFDLQHPGTRPFVRQNFGWSKSEDLVRKIHRERLSLRWNAAEENSGVKPIPKVNPYMENISTPYVKEEAKRKLTELLKDDWELMNYDNLKKGKVVKEMARLILEAKEKFDAEKKARKLPIPIETPLSAPLSPESDSQTSFNFQLQKKIRCLLEKTPSDRLNIIERKFLPEIIRDKNIRCNTFINRPKTTYDSYIRRKLTTKTIQFYLNKRHILSASNRNIGIGEGIRMPLPYRRFIISNLRPSKIFLPGSRLHHSTILPLQPLHSILPSGYPRIKIPKLKQKRDKYPKHRDPHNPEKAMSVKKKKKLNVQDEKKAKEKSQTSGNGGKEKGKKGQVSKKNPPKDSKEYKKWHRKQKEQRRKKKLRKWIVMEEKRRRVKITQEILMEQQFKGKKDLPGMRKKIAELEPKASKANDLVTYLSRRTDYLKEHYKDVYTRKHSEYHGSYQDWKEEHDAWFKLRDEIDKTNNDMKQQAADFILNCQHIINDTEKLEFQLLKEFTNLDIDYIEIIQFIKQEPIWQEEIEELKCKPFYYNYLFAFRQAREEGNLRLVSDLLQRKMHRDFMGMAYQERRKMRRHLPNACKGMLDERGLLAQEMNKISMWCNRLHRRREKVIQPEVEALKKEQDKLRVKIRKQVARRQPILLKSRQIKWSLKGQSLRWPRKHSSFQKMNPTLHRVERKFEKTDENLDIELEKNQQRRAQADAVKSHIANLQGMVARDYHQRQVNCQVAGKIAAALKRAFGIPSNFYQMHWPAKGAVQGLPANEPSSMVAHLNNVLDIAKASTAKAFIAPVMDEQFFVRKNLFRAMPVSLPKFSSL